MLDTTVMDRRQSYDALLLNADFTPMSISPLSLMPWQAALTAVLDDRVILVATYEARARSAREDFPLPSVVAMRNYVDQSRLAASTRWNILLAARFTCAYCGNRFAPSRLTFDHVIPRSRGGSSVWEDNIVVACGDCNERKADKTPSEAHMPLLVRPNRPTRAHLNMIALPFLKETTAVHQTWIDYLYWDTSLET